MNRFLRAGKMLLQQRTHRLATLPIIVVNLNDICNSRCLSCAIWQNNERLRNPAMREMSDTLLEEIYGAVAWWRPLEILLTGGEPTMHPRFAGVVSRLRELGPSVDVATNGLTLSRFEPEALGRVARFFVSFDAWDRNSYRTIRGVDGFERMQEGIAFVRSLQSRPEVIARCTLQRDNVGRLPELVDAAREAGCDKLSFLAVDTTSDAYGRGRADHAVDNRRISPGEEDLDAMGEGIAALERDGDDAFIESGIGRLRRLHHYFSAAIGNAVLPPVRCNAPWVSTVIETTGRIRPCFFHPVIGSLGELNGPRAIAFRRSLDVSTHPTCRRCVCSKSVSVRGLLRP